MENKTNTLGGFEAIFDSFIPKTEEEIEIDNNTDPNNSDQDNSDIDKDSIEDPVIEQMKKDNKIKDNKNAKGDKSKTDDNDDNNESVENVVDTEAELSDNEAETVSAFFGAMAEKLGWEFDEDEETPKDVESLIEYFENIIEEQSKPTFANEEIEALDTFVKQGGNLRDYLSIDAELDLNDIDIEDENNQKLVIKTFLKEKGFSDTRINKMISKYEDAGILEDEASDAIEDLKEITQLKKEKLLAEQETKYKQYREQQQLFYNNVVDEIKGLKNIRGIAIPEKDKKVLIDYILKPDTDGKTKYLKDYAKGGVKNLIESAYFTMNADKLIEAAKKEGNNSAILKFKNSLKNTSINGKSRQTVRTSDNDTIWDNFTKMRRVS